MKRLAKFCFGLILHFYLLVFMFLLMRNYKRESTVIYADLTPVKGKWNIENLLWFVYLSVFVLKIEILDFFISLTLC